MSGRKAQKLYNSITDVREEYIEEARSVLPRKKYPYRIKGIVAAACLVLVFAAAFSRIPRGASGSGESGGSDAGGVGIAVDANPDISLDGDPNGYSGGSEGAIAGGTVSAQQDRTEAEGEEQEEQEREEAVEDFPVNQDHAGEDSIEMADIISSYGEDSEACYKAPDNAAMICSVPLQKAMEEYGDTVLYKVVVDLFSDNNMLESGGETVKYEIDRLLELGYRIVLERESDGTAYRHYFVLYATKEQIVNFDMNHAYGYMFWLYDERVR